jgi:hypothetical protein
MQEQTRSTILQQKLPQGKFCPLSPSEKSATTAKHITLPSRLQCCGSDDACYSRRGDNLATTRLVHLVSRAASTLLVASSLLTHLPIGWLSQ